LEFSGLRKALRMGKEIIIFNPSQKKEISLKALVPPDKREMLLAGGLLAFLKSKSG
jgi:hypothetical protein